ncbi:serine/threonine-protein kinase-like protein [Pseudohyphozyma bogoriensis]|nr:serine/threonine-protein kinase-like protein [Pseudohyphozyma bogoriensis]
MSQPLTLGDYTFQVLSKSYPTLLPSPSRAGTTTKGGTRAPTHSVYTLPEEDRIHKLDHDPLLFIQIILNFHQVIRARRTEVPQPFEQQWDRLLPFLSSVTVQEIKADVIGHVKEMVIVPAAVVLQAVTNTSWTASGVRGKTNILDLKLAETSGNGLLYVEGKSRYVLRKKDMDDLRDKFADGTFDHPKKRSNYTPGWLATILQVVEKERELGRSIIVMLTNGESTLFLARANDTFVCSDIFDNSSSGDYSTRFAAAAMAYNRSVASTLPVLGSAIAVPAAKGEDVTMEETSGGEVAEKPPSRQRRRSTRGSATSALLTQAATLQLQYCTDRRQSVVYNFERHRIRHIPQSSSASDSDSSDDPLLTPRAHSPASSPPSSLSSPSTSLKSSPALTATEPDAPALSLPPFLLLSRFVGEGTGGTVFEAETEEGRVAVKIVDETDAEGIEMLKNEAAVLRYAQIWAEEHEARRSTAAVYGLFECKEDGIWALVLEYLEGSEASGGGAEFPMVRDAVTELHDRGILHGDVRLPNVLITGDGCVKFVDFGHGGVGTRGKGYFDEGAGEDLDALIEAYEESGLELAR